MYKTGNVVQAHNIPAIFFHTNHKGIKMINKSFVQSGNTFFTARDRGNELTVLPGGVYLVKFNPIDGFHLVRQDDMQMPSKTYGNNDGRAEKIINTFLTREGINTGVLLSGNKGSGKTLLSKAVCAKLASSGYPVILLEDAFAGTDFNQFMNSITQRCVVMIDEFEKKYSKEEHQNMLLSLLDGTGVNNKLFLLTSNSSNVSEFLISRPSRLFYHWHYGKLSDDVMVGYCEDNLMDKKHIENMVTLLNISSDMSFDVMQAIVEELNRYPDGNFVDLICDMNINLGDSLKATYMLEPLVWGDKVLCVGGQTRTVNLIDIQEGKSRMTFGTNLKSFHDILTFANSLGFKNFTHYNLMLAKQVEDGVTSIAEIEESEEFDNDCAFSFSFEGETDFISTERIEMTRMVAGVPITMKWKAMKADPMEAYFRRLFK